MIKKDKDEVINEITVPVDEPVNEVVDDEVLVEDELAPMPQANICPACKQATPIFIGDSNGKGATGMGIWVCGACNWTGKEPVHADVPFEDVVKPKSKKKAIVAAK